MTFSRILSLALGLTAALTGARADTASLGVVFQGEKTSLEIPLHNEGKEILWIGGVSMSCDCLHAAFSPMGIAPGETKTLGFTYQSAKPGRISVTVEVQGVEASTVVKTVTVTGLVADKSWLVSPAQLRGSDAVLIDLRRPAQFSQSHMPRALNLPAFAVKGRPDLRARKVILMDGGAAPDLLLEQVGSLRRLGFAQVFALDGGLAAWMRQGGALEGSGPATLAATSLSAADFMRSETATPWKIVEVTAGKPEILRWDGLVAAERWQDVEKILPGLSPSPAGRLAAPILVVAPDEATYARIEARVGAKNSVPLFYLSGGTRALADFLTQQTALTATPQLVTQARPAHGHLAASGGCNCGK